MREVIVAGAGVAGLAAAHRLLERGFDVTLLEANNFLGGKLGACQDADRPDWHEHAYHQYTNWYHNFWALMDEIGVRQHFLPMPILSHLFPGRYGQVYQLINFGSPWTALQNLFSGILNPADTYVYGYSLLDLISLPAFRGDLLERSSVLAFMAGRPYMTDQALANHSRNLAEAFASASFLSSARSYRSWVTYGFRLPEPSIWLLDGNTEETLFAPWRSFLEARAGTGHWGRLDIQMLTSVQELGLSVDGSRIDRIRVGGMRPAGWLRGERVRPTHTHDMVVNGDLVLAIPPRQLARLMTLEIAEHAPALANVRRLNSKPMISLELYFNRKLPDVPISVTPLLQSRFNLSFLDNSQIWRGWQGGTFLDVIASDADILINYSEEQIIRLMIEELRKFIRFDEADLERDRMFLKTNIGEELFLNEVGTWDYRPSATTAIQNLFIAGDFCRTPVDVVTIEGAVASGLLAADMLRRRHGVADPIPIVWPDTYPTPWVEALAMAGLPMAFAAKVAATGVSAVTRGYQALFPNG